MARGRNIEGVKDTCCELWSLVASRQLPQGQGCSKVYPVYQSCQESEELYEMHCWQDSTRAYCLGEPMSSNHLDITAIANCTRIRQGT